MTEHADQAAPGVLGTGLAFPFAADRRAAIALVGGEDDVAQAIRIILSTAPGERPMRPEFGCGVHEFVFDLVDPSTLGRMERAIRDALHRWEPRIELDDVRFEWDPERAEVLLIELTYRLRETTTVRNLVYPFYLVPAEGSGA
ncbi:baseplate wedge subunit [Baekduia alba]|uniref:GPW/gp25 family protein n=1 Tax=Baekduia alba TaxID=2997333 RepID=UPI00233FD6D5|nr:GPW/gp25 family protein [Baekduia alba]WCB93495.1 baseplate wedge subunit [Baekduia alba]